MSETKSVNIEFQLNCSRLVPSRRGNQAMTSSGGQKWRRNQTGAFISIANRLKDTTCFPITRVL